MKKEEAIKKQHISPYLLVIISFILVILVGAFLITLPCAQKSNNWGRFIDSFYIATSGTCVTGFDCYPTGVINNLNLFGQIVLAIMIQVGGLGFMTVLFFFVTLFKRKLSFRDRSFISQCVSSTSIPDVSKFLRKLLIVTFTIEIIGTLLGLPAFFTIYENKGEAVWGSIFFSISSFNNAGFDLFGTASLIKNYGSEIIDNMPNWAYYYMCSYSMVLIILGGISYLTLFEVFSFKKRPSQWRAFTKICISMSFILIVIGALLLFFTDGLKQTNPMSFFDCLFQSVTCRTAGFATYDPYSLSTGGRIVSCTLMFIGGSPLGTASGVKTTTMFIIMLAIYSFIRGRKVVAFKRFFSQTMIVKAMAVFITSLFIVIIGYLALGGFESANPQCKGEHIIYEVISSFSTTGFTTPLTTTLSVGGKLTCCVLMFLGRLGPMTMLQVFANNMHIEEKTHFKYVEEDLLIG